MGSNSATIERSALRIGMLGNLVMGFAGVLASVLSNSQALLVDGLFSLVGFFAAMIAVRVGKQSSVGPDETRPFGYAADESVFTTFRALSLLGLVVFALVGAVTKIATYWRGTIPAPVKFEVVGIYMVVVCLICAALWLNHRRCWKKTGQRSDILRLEARAAAFDGAITATAGVGFGIVYLLQSGPLAFIAPIGDSIIVIFLCVIAATMYWADFRTSLGELAGVSAGKSIVEKVRAASSAHLAEKEFDLVDVVVLKTGRTYSVAVFVNPKNGVTGEEMDALSADLGTDLAKSLGNTQLLLSVSAIGRDVLVPKIDGGEKEGTA